MTAFFQPDPNSTVNTFIWIERGNHLDTANCGECHPDAQSSFYPLAAQALMNTSGKDCSDNCHEWIDPVTTGDPFVTLNDTSSDFLKHRDLFYNTSIGGCAGTCHQTDPTNPIYDGSDHGVITSCLDRACHDDSDFNPSGGPLHDEHEFYLLATGFQCGDACHRGSGENIELIDGGCYDCHNSGHDPRILDTSPCYECHENNIGE
jgi:hypothetical protein